MKYRLNNSGIEIEASFTEDNIENIYLPLLRKLDLLQREKGRRILVMLAAPPAAGKSTLSAFLKYLSETYDGLTPVTVIGMDGFHRYQDYLLTHFTVRDGERIPLVKIKGAPETFDLARFKEFIKKVAGGENCGWPVYDRLLHNPKEDAVFVKGDIVLLEGNYLLLEEDGWQELRGFADFTVKIVAREEQLRDRLINRKISTGTSREEAKTFVDYSDMPNARLCLSKSGPADLTLRLKDGDSYEISRDTYKKL